LVCDTSNDQQVVDAGSGQIFDLNEDKRSEESVGQPRAQGILRLSCDVRQGQTKLSSLYQKGSLKALFPRPSDTRLDAVFLNTAGGITGGDNYRFEVDVSKDASLRITSQAAERVYKAQKAEVGNVAVAAKIAEGAKLHWLPQETIIFDEARLRRSLSVDMAGSSELLCVEPMVFGRAAMGETVQQADIRDLWEIRRDGELVFADATKISGNLDELLSHAAIAGGNIASAALLLVSPRAEAKLDRLRNDLGDLGGASLIKDGVLFARILAPDSLTLRRRLIPAIETLSDTTIPKNWRL